MDCPKEGSLLEEYQSLQKLDNIKSRKDIEEGQKKQEAQKRKAREVEAAKRKWVIPMKATQKTKKGTFKPIPVDGGWGVQT